MCRGVYEGIYIECIALYTWIYKEIKARAARGNFGGLSLISSLIS